jgi:hypothetical protein
LAPVVIAVPPVNVVALVELPAKNWTETRSTPPKSGFVAVRPEAGLVGPVRNCGVSASGS